MQVGPVVKLMLKKRRLWENEELPVHQGNLLKTAHLHAQSVFHCSGVRLSTADSPFGRMVSLKPVFRCV